MEQTLTLKVRLYPTFEQRQQLKAVSYEYQRICNLISNWCFDTNQFFDRKAFQSEMYQYLRNNSDLNSLMVQSAYRTVSARYRTVETQLRQSEYVYQDINTKQWYRNKRDLSWLRNPICFRRPQVDYVRKYNYSFVQNATKISMNVLGQRIKVSYNTHFNDILLRDDVTLGTATLVQLKHKWYLHIAYTQEVPEWQSDTNQNVIGIDRGLRQIMTTYDNRDKTKFFNGKKIAYQRRKYHYLRQQLQRKNTKSAKRKLKRLAQQENRWMNDVNHCLSKTLVDNYGQNSLFVLEDLTNITFERKMRTKRQTNELHSWAFYDLQMKLAYKAQRNGSNIITVSAKYTSQRCPKCGIVKKSNRDHHLHLYKCVNCGFKTNDDRIGAMNLYELGKRYMTGNDKPSFEKINVSD